MLPLQYSDQPSARTSIRRDAGVLEITFARAGWKGGAKRAIPALLLFVGVYGAFSSLLLLPLHGTAQFLPMAVAGAAGIGLGMLIVTVVLIALFSWTRRTIRLTSEHLEIGTGMNIARFPRDRGIVVRRPVPFEVYIRARGRVRFLLVSGLSSAEAGWLYTTLVEAMKTGPASGS